MSRCEWVELNQKEVVSFLNSASVVNILNEVADGVRKNAGPEARINIRASHDRKKAFVEMPYEEASKNNKLLKAVRAE